MSDNTVRLKIKVEDDNSFRNIEANAEELRNAIDKVRSEADKVNSSLINSNQIAQAFEQVSSAVQGLQSVMHDFTNAYAAQVEAETRLSTVMRNTMDATEAEIQSIKDLASAQQQLGIVGDEVQLSGAQELATYMSKKENLEKLIPVMNDMIAQQYGYNATQESAVNIATMMGKVMEGQTGALSRYGYSFTEAQEQILKFGTEEERAATLSEVITESVGGVNQALAQTPYGKIKQVSNSFGDLKEKVGGLVAPAMNAVDNISRITIAVSGIGKGVATIKALSASLKSMSAGLRSATVAQRGLNTAMKANVFIAVASAIAALVAIVVDLAKADNDAAEAADGLSDANRSMANAVGDAKAEIDSEIAKLKTLIEKGGDATEAISTLNQKYGEAFGVYNTAKEWYDVLIAKSEAYCRQIGYEAKAKALSAEIGAKIVERDALKEGLPQGDWKWDKSAGKYRDMSMNFTIKYADKDTHIKLVQIANLDRDITSMTTEMQDAFGAAAAASDELNGTIENGSQAVEWQKMSYADLGKEITSHETKLKGLIGIDEEAAKKEKKLLDAMKQRQESLGKTYGLNSGSTSPTTSSSAPSTRKSAEIIPALVPKSIQQVELGTMTLAKLNAQLNQLEQDRLNASKEELPAIDAQIERVKKMKDEFQGVVETASEIKTIEMPSFADGWSSIKGIGDSIRSINSALTESDDLWSAITGTVDGFISLMQGITQVVQMVNTLTQAQRAAATANAASAATGAAASMANIPWVGPALAIAAVAAVLASLASLPKFANGGLVYGPTVGLMGEYGGASNNPEVIAPLSKLKGMLAGGGGNSEVKFRIEGRELVGIMNKQNNIYSRTK